MDEILKQLQAMQTNVDEFSARLNLPAKKAEIETLQAETLSPDFWSDDVKAKSTMQRLSSLQSEIDQITTLDKEITDLIDLAELASVESDPDLLNDIKIQTAQLEKKLKKVSLLLFLQGEYDQGNALVSIHSGQGGVEAMDWAEMLLRMYLRYFESRSWSVEILNQSFGEEAGIKSTTLLVSSPYAYGLLKNESGTHRLVRLSPFNADNLRQTSFALVEVLPELPDNETIDLPDDELEWQFFRASGKGGQNVNKVSTAVRLKHIPTGIIVESQAERSQVQNRALALTLLKSKLWERQEKQKSEKLENIKGSYHPASWGTQIRSYVLHPYQLVKDNRTEVELTDTEAVLNGDIQPFIDAEIQL